jgi:hypothetical protein
MSCPCGLTKEEVLEVARKHGVPLAEGKCQNPLADGSDGKCGKALGAHPSSQGNFNFIKNNHAINHAILPSHCMLTLLHLINILMKLIIFQIIFALVLRRYHQRRNSARQYI